MRRPDTMRGLHPPLRVDGTAGAERHWLLDETALGSSGKDAATLGTTNDLEQLDALAMPTPAQGFVGMARRWTAGTPAILRGAGDATIRAALGTAGEWTLSAWVRLRTLDDTQRYTVWAAEEDIADPLIEDPEQRLAVIAFDGFTPVLAWENGSALEVSVDGFSLRPYVWTLITWRRYNAAAFKTDIDFLVNSRLIETFAAQSDPFSLSGDAALYVGGEYGVSAPTTILNPWVGDIGGVYFTSRKVTDEELRQDVRRASLWGPYTTVETRVDIEDSAGRMVDYTHAHGADFLASAAIKDSTDQFSSQATVTLIRRAGRKSLAPLVTTSKLNLTNPDDLGSYAAAIEISRAIEVFHARVPAGLVPEGSDWWSRFKGTIQDVDPAKGTGVVIEALDDFNQFEAPVWVEAAFGSADPESPIFVDEVMQAISDANDSSVYEGSYPPTTIELEDTPDYAIAAYNQRREPIRQAFKTLIGLLGWDVRQRWVERLERWATAVYDPGRERVDVDAVLEPSEILDITEARTSIKPIRTVMRIVFPSVFSWVGIEENPELEPEVPADFEITWGGGGTIADTGDALPAWVEVLYRPSFDRYRPRRPMEVQEKQTTQVETFQKAANFAVALLWDLSEPEMTHGGTTLPLPELTIQDIIGLLPNPELYTAPQYLAIANISHDTGERSQSAPQLRGRPAAGFKRWLQIEATPGLDAPPLMDANEALGDKSLRDLLPIVTQLFEGSTFGQGGKFLQVRNSAFQQSRRGEVYEPDGWAVLDGDWRTDVDATDESANGTQSVIFLTSDGRIASELIPVDGGEGTAYGVEIRWQQLTGASSTRPRVILRWYDADKLEVARAIHPAGVETAAVHTAIERTSNVAMVTCTEDHGFAVGDLVQVATEHLTSNGKALRTRKAEVLGVLDGDEVAPWADNEYGTLAGPTASNFAMGYRFTPSVDGRITELGAYFGPAATQRTVKLIDHATSAVLGSVQVTGDATGFVYTALGAPIDVTAGTKYIVAVYLAGANRYQRGSVSFPDTFGDVTIEACMYVATGDDTGTPSTSVTTIMYGMADVKFVPANAKFTYANTGIDFGSAGDNGRSFLRGRAFVPALPTTSGAWRSSREVGIEAPPGDAKWVSIEIDTVNTGTFRDLVVDSVSIYRVAQAASVLNVERTNLTDGALAELEFNESMRIDLGAYCHGGDVEETINRVPISQDCDANVTCRVNLKRSSGDALCKTQLEIRLNNVAVPQGIAQTLPPTALGAGESIDTMVAVKLRGLKEGDFIEAFFTSTITSGTGAFYVDSAESSSFLQVEQILNE